MQTQLELYKDTIAYIESIIHENPSCAFVLLMDMNCNMFVSNNKYSMIIRDFTNKYDLIPALQLNPSFDSTTDFSRCDVKTKSLDGARTI